MTAQAFRGRRRGVLVAFAAAVPVTMVLSTAVGSVAVPPADIVRTLVGGAPSDPRWEVLIETIRLPRGLTAALAGAALAAAGVQMQTLFRNALADPYVLGVSSGASLGVAMVVLVAGGGASVLSGELAAVAGSGHLSVVLAAALGAAGVLAVVLGIARWVRSPVSLLLVGVMVGYLATALVSVLLRAADPQWAQRYIAWGMGSFGATAWPDLAVLAPVVGVGLVAALLTAKQLNALLLGEDYARSMGLSARRARFVTLFCAAALAGSVTAFCGPVAFLGLAVPHVARMALATSDHRMLMPAAILLGAAVALGCGAAAEALVLPLNAVTSLVGAPIVVTVLVRGRRLGMPGA